MGVSRIPDSTSVRGTEFFSGSSEFEAKVTSDGELATTATERERNVSVHYKLSAISTTTYSILVDLSDTSNFPHDETGRIDISFLNVRVDKASNTNGTIGLGVITRIDGTDADIDFLFDVPFEENGRTVVSESIAVSPSQYKFDSSFYITNVVQTSVTAVNTGLTLDSPNGSITPAVGDIIVLSSFTAGGNYNLDIEALYHGEA